MRLADNKAIFNINKSEVIIEIGKTSYSEAYSLFANSTIAFTIPNVKGEAKITITDDFYGIDYADVTLTFVDSILKSITVNPLWKAIRELDDRFDIRAIKAKCEAILSANFEKVSDMYSVVTFEADDLVITSLLTCNSECDNYYLITSRPDKDYF
jgi:hypothetical protein